MKVAIPLLLLPILALASSASLCETFISQLHTRKNTHNYNALTEEEQAFLEYSSKLPYQDLGERNFCEQISLMKYLIAVREFNPEGISGFYYESHGLCIPNYCEKIVLSADQQLMRKIFEIKSWPTYDLAKAQVAQEGFFLYNPDHSSREKQPLFYIILILHGLFFLASFGSVVYIYLYRKKLCKTDPEEVQRELKNNCYPWIVKAFDLKSNAINLYQTAKEQKLNENIAVFQFLRVITCYWVVYFHNTAAYLPLIKQRDGDPSLNEVYYTKDISLLELNGGLSVDYFFMMTGFLGAYTLVPKFQRQKFGFFAFLDTVKHRFLRIWPLYMIAFFFYWQVVPNLGSGPLWYLYEVEADHCDKLWWTNFLMIANITTRSQIKTVGNDCFIIAWYLNIEFQMYLIAILAFACYARYRKIGLLVVICLIFQSFGQALGNHFYYEIPLYDRTPEKNWLYLFKHKFTTYTSWYPLFIGALWGLWYFEYTKLKKRNIFWFFETRAIVSYFTMACGVALNMFVMFAPNKLSGGLRNWNDFLKFSWGPLQRWLITVSITLIFMPLCSNRRFYLKSFLNLRIFQIFGKTSFLIYLYHQPILRLMSLQRTSFRPFSYGEFVASPIMAIVVTQAFSIIIHLTIEKPLLNIEGYFTKKSQARKAKKVQESKPIEQPPQSIKQDYYELNEPQTAKSPQESFSGKEVLATEQMKAIPDDTQKNVFLQGDILEV